MNIPVSVLWGSKNTKQFPFRLIFILTLQDDKLSAALTFHNSLRTSVISYQFAFLGPHWFFHWHSGNQWMTSDLQLLLRGYCWIIKMRIFFQTDVLFCFQKALMMRRSQPQPQSRNMYTLKKAQRLHSTGQHWKLIFLVWWDQWWLCHMDLEHDGTISRRKKKKTWARNKPASRFFFWWLWGFERHLSGDSSQHDIIAPFWF